MLKTATSRLGHSPKGRGGRPPAGEAASRAAYLQDVAIEVFLEFGFERTNLNEIVKRAGASKETLYSRYKKKSDLFVAVITNHIESHMRPLSDLLEEGGSLEHRRKNFAFRLLTAILEEGRKNSALVVFAEAGRFPQLGKRFWEIVNQKSEAELAVFMETQIANGSLRKNDPMRMSQDFFCLVSNRVILRSILNIERVLTVTQRRSIADAAVGTFLQAYGV